MKWIKHVSLAFARFDTSLARFCVACSHMLHLLFSHRCFSNLCRSCCSVVLAISQKKTCSHQTNHLKQEAARIEDFQQSRIGKRRTNVLFSMSLQANSLDFAGAVLNVCCRASCSVNARANTVSPPQMESQRRYQPSF
jgi:hypothetical protein